MPGGRPRNVKGLCTEGTCRKPEHLKKFCTEHYMRNYRVRKAIEAGEPVPVRYSKRGEVCAHGECPNKKIRARGLCFTHYNQYRLAAANNIRLCKVDQCLNEVPRGRKTCASCDEKVRLKRKALYYEALKQEAGTPIIHVEPRHKPKKAGVLIFDDGIVPFEGDSMESAVDALDKEFVRRGFIVAYMSYVWNPNNDGWNFVMNKRSNATVARFKAQVVTGR